MKRKYPVIDMIRTGQNIKRIIKQLNMAKNIENPMGKAMVTTQSLLIEAAVITVVVPCVKGIGHTDVEKRQQG